MKKIKSLVLNSPCIVGGDSLSTFTEAQYEITEDGPWIDIKKLSTGETGSTPYANVKSAKRE